MNVLFQDMADKAANCKHGMSDTLTLTDGTLTPIYKCTHPEMSPRGQHVCRLMMINNETYQPFGCDYYDPIVMPEVPKGLLRKAGVLTRIFQAVRKCMR